MEFEFDPAKDEANLAKHGLALGFAPAVFAADDHVILTSFRTSDGEERCKAIGLVDAKLYTVVHTWRGEVARFFSVRRSNSGEQAYYYRHSG